MGYVMKGVGLRSDHATMVWDVANVMSGAVYGEGKGTNIRELKDWEQIKPVPIRWRRWWNETVKMREDAFEHDASEEGKAMLDDFREVADSLFNEQEPTMKLCWRGLRREVRVLMT